MCTGFVSFFNQPLYGMNFDFYKVPMRLRIRMEANKKIFAVESFIENKWLENMTMNEGGLFANVQSNWSDQHLYIKPGPNQIPMLELYKMMMQDAESVKDVMDIIGSKTIVHNTLPPDSELNKVHHLVADRYGGAVIIESKNYQNDITPIKGKYMVMTNFPNGEFSGKHYSEAKHPKEESRSGHDRYRNVSGYIWNHRDSFGLDDALEALKIASGKDETWETLISAVFDPLNLEIFLVVTRDFGHRWRVILKDGILETYSGFNESKHFDLGSAEILVADLEKVRQ